jgi:hypothetical protein
MGVWGTGLYSGDFALDLRSMVTSLCRLPLSGDRILEILRDNEPAADQVQNEDHATFWLVVADQFVKRGIQCAGATETALKIIHERMDSAVMRRLERRLLEPAVKRDRRTLRKPQEFIMDIGDVFVYPTSRFKPLNPYLKRKEDNYRPPFNWAHEGWSAMVIFNRGRSFDYLAWYAILVLDNTYPEKPTLEQLMHHSAWVVTAPGTCSRGQLQRMDTEKIAHVDVDPQASARFYPSMRSCINATASDISIANHMRARPVKTSKGPWPTVPQLASILKEAPYRGG